MGTNDASNEPRKVSVEKYVDNLKEMVHIASQHNVKVILVGPALHDPVDPDTTRSSAINRLYSEAAKQLAEQLSVGFVDLWTAFADAVGYSGEGPQPSLSHLLVDGIHYTAEGYRIYYNCLKDEIKSKYPQYDSDDLEMQFPPWDMVDPTNPLKTFESWENFN